MPGQRHILSALRLWQYDLLFPDESPMSEDLIAILRAATLEDVARATEYLYVAPPRATHADLLEFFNYMLDVLIGEDTGEQS
jgi:hypothetical protein